MLVFLSVVILCGLIYATLNTKSNEILSEIKEFKKEIHSCYRGVEMELRGIEYKIEELKEMVGEDNASLNNKN